jgi:hypothetical protein
MMRMELTKKSECTLSSSSCFCHLLISFFFFFLGGWGAVLLVYDFMFLSLFVKTCKFYT